MGIKGGESHLASEVHAGPSSGAYCSVKSGKSNLLINPPKTVTCVFSVVKIGLRATKASAFRDHGSFPGQNQNIKCDHMQLALAPQS
jgi:hypothetical protein